MSASNEAWPRVRLGDLLQIKHGFAFKGDHFSDGAGDIVLTPGNFESGGGLKLRPGKDRSYTGAYPSDFKLKTGDLLIVMTDLTQEAAILGAPAFVPSTLTCLHNQRLGKVVDIDERRADRRFLFHLFNTVDYRAHVKATATGSTVRHTSPSRIYEHHANIPPLGVQIRIAEILGAYDDLIEVNRLRVGGLERMARDLFDEWFVRLRFPGHENVPLNATPGGFLPEGWRRTAIGETFDNLYDGPHATPPTSDAGGVFLGIGNITATGQLDLTSVRRIAEADLGRWTKRVTPAGGDIVFTYEATLNRYAIIPEGFRGCLGRRLALIRTSQPGMNYYLFQYFFSNDWRSTIAKNTLSGATVDRVPLTRFPDFPITLPPLHLVERFGRIVQPVFALKERLDVANRNLAASRDHLLTRLMSGQLSVSAAEQELEAA